MPRCTATVMGPRVHSWRCTRNAVVERDGKGYCRQHDPEAVKAKRKKESEARDAEQRADERRRREAEARCQALGAGTPHYHVPWTGMGGYNGSVLLTADEADALIARLKEHK